VREKEIEGKRKRERWGMPECLVTRHSCDKTFLHASRHFTTRQRTATHCSTLQHTAAHCNTMQHTATHCKTFLHASRHFTTRQRTATHCSTLQHTAAHCITMQHNATHCKTFLHASRLFLRQECRQDILPPFPFSPLLPFLSLSLTPSDIQKCLVAKNVLSHKGKIGNANYVLSHADGKRQKQKERGKESEGECGREREREK